MTTTIIFTAALLWASTHEWDRPRVFYFHFGLAESAVLGAFCAQDLALFVAFFDLMLIPFYFLSGIWGGPDRVQGDDPAGHLHAGRLVLHARRRDRHRRAGLQPARHAPLTFVISSAAGPAALTHHADVGVPGLRRRLPGQDAARSVPRLAARRLQGDADPGRGGVLRDPVQGRRLRLPAHRAAAVPLRRGALPDADADHRPGLDPLGDAGGHDHARRAAGHRLLERGPAGLHHAGHLLAAPRGRPGRAAADGQPRAGHRAAVLHRRRAGGARRRLGEARRHGRDRLPRPRPGQPLPHRDPRVAGHARVGRTSSGSS